MVRYDHMFVVFCARRAQKTTNEKRGSTALPKAQSANCVSPKSITLNFALLTSSSVPNDDNFVHSHFGAPDFARPAEELAHLNSLAEKTNGLRFASGRSCAFLPQPLSAKDTATSLTLIRPLPSGPERHRERFRYERARWGGRLLTPAELQAIHRYVAETYS